MSKSLCHPKKSQTISQNPVTNLDVGDCIVVQPGVKEPNFGFDIGGWQGRITEIETYKPGQVTIMFQWDSLALKCMPTSAIRRSEENGLDWTTIGLYPEEFEKAGPCDTQADVDEIVEELSAEHNWDYLGKQGQRIHKVLQDVDEDNDLEAFEAWQEYLEAHLQLPFDAAVSESQEHGPLRFGDQVKVIGFEGVEYL
jgi:hypothetical protein